MATISEAIAIALQHHRAGRLQAAEQIYRQVLAIDPNQADVLHLSGVIAHQTGRLDSARDLIERAIRLRPSDGVYYNNLGNILKDQGRLDEAILCYRRALEQKPDYAVALNNLGTVLQTQGQAGEAITCYRQALKQNPNLADAHNNLGAALREHWKLEEAIVCHRRALALNPNFAEAHNNLGNALKELGSLTEATVSYRRAIELKPDYSEALNNLGNVLKDQGKLDEAVVCYRRALAAKADDANVHGNLGNSLREQGKTDEAIASYRRALELKPGFVSTLAALVHELQHACQWNELDQLSQRVIAFVDEAGPENGYIPPFTFLALPTPTTCEQQLRCAQQWINRQLKSVAEIRPGTMLSQSATRNSKIKIGYLSSDFQAHPTAWLIAELFEKHDRSQFEILGYSFGPDDRSAMRQRLVKGFDQFIDIRNASYTEAAQRISSDGVDILVDLKGYTRDSRTQILAMRPAPIQINYLGFPATMGASFIDYILVDEFVVPSDHQPFFTEKLVHLPGCYQINDSLREIAPRTLTRSECGLPESGFVFCSFNNSYKITPKIFDVWMNLLRAIPESILWLLEGNRSSPANLRREAQARGISADRLVFAPRLPLSQHLARHRLADLFLDTFPVNAHTTASDALWAGCPVLTLVGETFVSRVAGSLLRTLGLPELIATSLQEYETLALRLSQDAGMLADLKSRLAANRPHSRLFDAAPFAISLEKAFLAMWNIHEAGEPPRAMQVDS